jgi:5'-methylthioadenosine phosphorylase
VIGMTNMPEAKLAREAEICYATVAMSTDYDCWHEDEEDVSVDAIIEIMQTNVARAQEMLQSFFTASGSMDSCACNCQQALENGIFADLKSLDDDAIRPIHALVERFL